MNLTAAERPDHHSLCDPVALNSKREVFCLYIYMRSNKPFTNRKDNQLLPTIHWGQIFHSMPYVLYEVLIKMQYKKYLYILYVSV